MTCKQEFSIQSDKLVSIRQLLNDNEDSSFENIFLTSTIFHDTQLVENLKSMGKSIASAKQDYEKYFQELKKTFDVAWDKAKIE